MKIASIVLYLVVTIAMITFIMLQRGSGASAGSGFGAGASGTVFGARGSANFLSSATKWLAVAFFALSLGMAVYETRSGLNRQATEDLGVMGNLPPVAETPDASLPPPDAAAVPTAATGAAPAAAVGDAPAASVVEVPAAPAAATDAAASSSTAAAPAEATSSSGAASSQAEEKQP